MCYTIGKRFRFEAAHHLPHLPVGHKCSRPHGHSYEVTVELSADDLNSDGFVLDYGLLDCIKYDIAQTLDHRDLNEVFPAMATTAELLAHTLYMRWQMLLHDQVSPLTAHCLRAVSVCETENTYAEYRPKWRKS